MQPVYKTANRNAASNLHLYCANFVKK